MMQFKYVTLQAACSISLKIYKTVRLKNKCKTVCKLDQKYPLRLHVLKVVTSEKIGGSGVISTLGTLYGGVVMGVLLTFNEAAILY